MSQKQDGSVLQGGWGGLSKIRTRHNANGEGIRIASRQGPCSLGARYSTRRKSNLRLGERDVEGREDDWEGELEHVCSN